MSEQKLIILNDNDFKRKVDNGIHLEMQLYISIFKEELFQSEHFNTHTAKAITYIDNNFTRIYNDYETVDGVPLETLSTWLMLKSFKVLLALITESTYLDFVTRVHVKNICNKIFLYLAESGLYA